MRTELETDGRVRIMCGHLSAKCPHVIGQLFRFWSLGDKHATDDGVLYGWTPEAVDEYLAEPGFCQAMPADWIDLSGPWVKLPEYHEHNGTTTKRRISEAKRKARERCKVSAQNADKCPQNVQPVSAGLPPSSSLLLSPLGTGTEDSSEQPPRELDPDLARYFDLSRQDLASGRYPLKAFPHVWLRTDELRDAREQFDKAGLTKDDWRDAMKRANVQLEGKQSQATYKSGKAYSYLTGHILQDAIETKTKANRLNGHAVQSTPEPNRRAASRVLNAVKLEPRTMEGKT